MRHLLLLHLVFFCPLAHNAGAVVLPAFATAAHNGTLSSRDVHGEGQIPFHINGPYTSARGLATFQERTSQKLQGGFFVHITDPQLGMKNQYEENPRNWNGELDMFTKLVKAAAKMKPVFIFIGGDMQNYWPNHDDPRNKNNPVSLEHDQVKDIKDVVKREAGSIPVIYTPGNHDIGDFPDKNTLKHYWDEYKLPLMYSVTSSITSALIIQINSQFYQSENYEIPKEMIQQFLESELQKKASRVNSIIILTHIPPFMDKIDEDPGWANWIEADRRKVLGALLKYNLPVYFVCGHFHANVEKRIDIVNGAHLKIFVSSASGSTMQWDGQDTLISQKASEVAQIGVGPAFFKYIMGGKPEDKGGKDLIIERIQPIPTRSGLSIFTIDDNGQVQHVWKTVSELGS